MSYKDGIFNLSNDREELGKACERAYKDTSNKSLYSDAYEKVAKRASELENKPLDDDFLASSFKALYDPKGQGIESATDAEISAAAIVMTLVIRVKYMGGGYPFQGARPDPDFVGAAMGEAAKKFDELKREGKAKADDGSWVGAAQAAGEFSMQMWAETRGRGGAILQSLVERSA